MPYFIEFFAFFLQNFDPKLCLVGNPQENKNQLKSEYADSLLPDIVPLSLPASPGNQASASPLAAPCNSYNSRDLYHSGGPGFLRITASDVDISLSPSASDELIFKLIKAVRHA